MAERRLERWLRPRVVLPVLGVLVLLAVIFSPTGGEDETTRLTTYGTSPYAAQGIYEVLGVLGWHVGRRRSAFGAGMDTAATYLVLLPPNQPSATEVSALLAAVRRGATVLAVPEPGSPMADSLRIQRSEYPQRPSDIAPPADGDSLLRSTVQLRTAAQRARTIEHYLVPVPVSDDDTAPVFPPDVTTLLRVQIGAQFKPAIMERRIGRGRALVIGGVNAFRNGNVRDTAAAVFVVQLMERLSPDHARPLIFDEYHQGYGDSSGPTAVVWHALVWTTTGRVATQLMIAGLVLLMAIGIRPIAPRTRRAIERRSPFEHVGALSRAYEQVRATRLATRRLVRGLRRRHPLGTGAADDAQYLSLLAGRAPAAADQVEVLRRAIEQPLPADAWVAVGGAIEHIERTLNL